MRPIVVYNRKAFRVLHCEIQEPLFAREAPGAYVTFSFRAKAPGRPTSHIVVNAEVSKWRTFVRKSGRRVYCFESSKEPHVNVLPDLQSPIFMDYSYSAHDSSTMANAIWSLVQL